MSMTREDVFLLIVVLPVLAMTAWITWKLDGHAIRRAARRWFRS